MLWPWHFEWGFYVGLLIYITKGEEDDKEMEGLLFNETLNYLTFVSMKYLLLIDKISKYCPSI